LSRTTLFGFAAVAAAVVLVTGCGGGGKKSSATTTPSPSSSVAAMGARPSQTRAEIRQNWEAFFDGSSSTAKRVSLLQNGEQFTKTISTIGGSALAKQATAKVTNVKIDGPSKATVTFTLLLSGTPVLQGLKGSAVLVDSTWKVGIASLCQLASLEGVAPKACSSAAK
jgi:hypothetical protein